MENKRLAIVTGATGGMGRVITEDLLRRGYRVVMACRNICKAEEVKSSLISADPSYEVEVMYIDLTSLASVKDFVGILAERNECVDLLINNAGIMSSDAEITVDGYEKNLSVNYLAPAVLTLGLINMMKPGSRIINTVSCTCRIGKVDNDIFIPKKLSFHRFRSYGSAKLAMMLFTAELAERMRESRICVYAVDPGIVDTGIITMDRWFDPLADRLFRPFIKSPEKGASTAIKVISMGTAEQSGSLWRGGICLKMPSYAANHQLREWLCTETLKIADRIKK